MQRRYKEGDCQEEFGTKGAPGALLERRILLREQIVTSWDILFRAAEL